MDKSIYKNLTKRERKNEIKLLTNELQKLQYQESVLKKYIKFLRTQI